MCVVHTMFVCLACCVGAKPSLLGILKLVVPTIAIKWKELGQCLGVECAVLDTVRCSEPRADEYALELLGLWPRSAAGMDSQPRTWHSLLAAVETVIGRRERDKLQAFTNSEHRAERCALELLGLWSQSAAGTGSQPRTWHSLLAAVETVIGHREREKIEAKLKTMSPSPSFDENCQEVVSVYKPHPN